MNSWTAKIRILVVFLAAMLAGCATNYSLVKPERQSVGALSVEPGVEWNRVNPLTIEGEVETWTLDGPVLNQLIFFEGVADDEPLFKPRSGSFSSAKQDEKPPVFRSNMNPFEVQELVQATIARRFQTTIAECRNLKPVQFAGERGFRFDTKFTERDDEVDRKGMFIATVRGGRLYGIWFFGAGSHYFDRYVPDFTRLADSVRIAGKTEAAK
ncbi:MAG TPA: hypothetical protein VEG37_05240 [Burkholderiales bacterium]|nr:hypothetical protein [Burkholderiales bacterium]